MIKVNTKCPNCGNNFLKEKKNKNFITNPIKLKLRKKLCRKVVNLSENTFFASFPKIPISVIMKIIELFILEH